jgi:hypothetical protein
MELVVDLCFGQCNFGTKKEYENCNGMSGVSAFTRRIN